jgi:putative Mg2+ transporter-C (MgtC) family protein
MAFEIGPAEMDIIAKLLISAFLGGVVGLEREFNRSAAGLKTYAIVCMGSALFTLASALVDLRIAAGVITGIGFLGAATIVKTDNRVVGITTAALIWTVAAVGFVVGMGLYFAAAVATGLLIFILVPVEMFEKKYLDKVHAEKGF